MRLKLNAALQAKHTVLEVSKYTNTTARKMRLLNVYTLQLSEFFASAKPPYIILSHRWGQDEPTYQQYRKSDSLNGQGYQKIIDLCTFVRNGKRPTGAPGRSFVVWVWLDTICIDKRSSAELSEAINSMFNWYENAVECIVYLSDMPEYASQGDQEMANRLSRCAWFWRGWTLQELLAPYLCVFVNSSWQVIGHLCDKVNPSHGTTTHGPEISVIISAVTWVPSEYLKPNTLHVLNDERFGDVSIAQRMSWAAHRSTTRIEDEAHCLFGLFGINMPLIYGEGSKAFLRLQEEILKRSTDQSLFAWRLHPDKMSNSCALLAPSPKYFRHLRSIVKMLSDLYESTYSLTNRGLYVEAHVLQASGLIWRTAVAEKVELAGERMENSKQAGGVRDNDVILLLPLNCYDSNTTYNESYFTPGSDQPWMLAVRGVNDQFFKPSINGSVEYNGGFCRVYMTEDVKTKIWTAVGAANTKARLTIEAYPWKGRRLDGNRLYQR